MYLLCCLLTTFIIAWILTAFARYVAIATNQLDLPNHRSSHNTPKPRGGGLAFVITFLISVIVLMLLGYVDLSYGKSLLIAGSSIAALGMLADKNLVAPFWRLLVQCLIAIIAYNGLKRGFNIFSSNFLNNLFGVLYLVWLLNLYNFMDGIDGLAAIEAISVCIGAMILYLLNCQYGEIYLPLVLTASVFGFLCWNFPTAKIFMGDVGSGFLGLTLGLMSIHAQQVNSQLFWSWIILLGVFIIDTGLTLVTRILKKEKIFQAHCNHAYQHAARIYKKHSTVTIGVLLINFLWLFPFALFVGHGYLDTYLGLFMACLPLIGLALKFSVGRSCEDIFGKIRNNQKGKNKANALII